MELLSAMVCTFLTHQSVAMKAMADGNEGNESSELFVILLSVV